MNNQSGTEVILGTLPDMIFRVTREGIILSHHSPMDAKLSASPESFLGKNIKDLLPPNVVERAMSSIINTIETGQISTIEYSLSRPTGSLCYEGRIQKLADSEVILELRITTDRKMTEEGLHFIADSVPTPFSYVDQDHLFQFINKAFENWYGKFSSENIGKHMRDVLGGKAYDKILHHVKAALAGEEQIFEDEIPYKTGKRFVKAHYIPRFQNNRVMGFYASIMDISDLKKVEHDLRESRESKKQTQTQLHDAIESLPISFAIYDAEERLVLCNSKTLEMYPEHASILKPGVSFEKIVRTTVDQAIIDVDENGLEKYVLERLRGFRDKPKKFEQTRKDGRTFVIYYRPTPEGGTVIIRIDITEQKNAEKDLQRSKRLLQTVFDTIPHWVMVKDRESRYLMVNKAFAESYGKKPSDFENIHPKALGLNDEELEYFLEADRRVIDTGEKVVNPKFVITYPDGRRTIQRAIRLPFLDESGKIIGVVVDVEDITERSLLEAQLLHSQKMEAVGGLAGGIAHNFNNLLQVISGNLSVLEMGMDDSHPHRKILSSLERSVKKGAKLTSQLLGFASGGKNEGKSIQINDVIDRIGVLVMETHKEIHIKYDLDCHLANTIGDLHQIEQVLMNILINSWQAMPQGGYLLLQSQNVIVDDDFSTRNEIKPGPFIKVSVIDTGIGMDQDTIDRIFDPFFTTKEIGQGTGLGLSSAYGIVKNHHGVITVDSELGKGTTINIFLPGIKEEK